ncbi:MAG: magnesium chelatase domain-containing protein, partial [Patescibacteria group bacterium]
TDEVGVFKMESTVLQEVANPSSLFLAERHAGAGAVVTCLMQGSRGLLLEVQALVSHSRQSYPKRSAAGFDYKRLEVLLAVLGERANVKLNWSDVYVNLVGGLKSREPALDLAVCLAVASAYLKKPVSREVVIFGEVGLGGEVRPVAATDKRLNEAARLGFTEAVLPPLGEGVKVPKGIMVVEIHNLAEAVEWMK